MIALGHKLKIEDITVVAKIMSCNGSRHRQRKTAMRKPGAATTATRRKFWGTIRIKQVMCKECG